MTVTDGVRGKGSVVPAVRPRSWACFRSRGRTAGWSAGVDGPARD